MKVLVTGAGGFLGSRIGASLLGHGAASTVLLHHRRLPRQDPAAALRRRFLQSDVAVTVGNLTARDTLGEMLEGVELVVHSAAGMKGAAADMFLNTVVATRNLLDACVAARVRRIVLVSSFAVYHTEELPNGAVMDESTPLEPLGVVKGLYGYVKVQQEKLFREYRDRFGFEGVILRPGVIYGPGGGGMSPRVGLPLAGWFVRLGGRVKLPLTYVDNCADAIALAAMRAPAGSVFNVVDDELPTCIEYLQRYRREVQPLRVLPVPYWAFMAGARWLGRYSERSGGQLPAVFTPQIVRSMYRPLEYSNAALKAIGWQPRVTTAQGMTSTFEHLRAGAAGGDRGA